MQIVITKKDGSQVEYTAYDQFEKLEVKEKIEASGIKDNFASAILKADSHTAQSDGREVVIDGSGEVATTYDDLMLKLGKVGV